MIKKEKIKVYDMTCSSCEDRVEREVKKLPGVISAIASFLNEELIIEYDTNLCNTDEIKSAIKKAGYNTKKHEKDKILGILLIAAAILMFGNYTGGIDMSEKLGQNATYFVLLVVGLLTSIHCVGMCGGIMLSQTVSQDNMNKLISIKPAFLYNMGRLISYTILGGIVGAIGSVLSLSPVIQAGIMIFAGVFMILMGLNLYGFSWFRRFTLKLPFLNCSVNKQSKSPFIIGLLNGLMPCGPLQTMQIYALGTGSAIKGASSMFVFALGTIPLMLTFGAATGFLSKGYSKKILKFSGILIIILGFVMSNRGLALVGININPMDKVSTKKINSSNINENKAEIKDGIQIIRMSATYSGYEPRVFIVQKDIPVKWIINGEQITSCNNQIIVPSLNIKKNLKSGENIIEFIPKDNKDINFSCWMGMIRGVIKVVDNVNSVSASSVNADLPPSTGGSCCSADSAYSQQNSIYGNDISKVPTEILVKTSSISAGVQKIKITGTGYEFEPLVAVVNKNMPVEFVFSLDSFDNPDQEFKLVDGASNKTVAKFEGKKGDNILNYNFKENGVFGIVDSKGIQMLIEVVDDIKNVDIEKIRSKYLR